jgi:hypothetical protein
MPLSLSYNLQKNVNYQYIRGFVLTVQTYVNISKQQNIVH